MTKWKAWFYRAWLLLPVVILAAGVSVVGQSCPPQKTVMAATMNCYSTYDGEVRVIDSDSYSDAHDAASGTTILDYNYVGVENSYYDGWYRVTRAFFYFDVSGLPDNAIVTGQTFHFYVDEYHNDDPSNTFVVCWNYNVDTYTYPGTTIEASDFNKTNYDIDYGHAVHTMILTDLTEDAWNTDTGGTTGPAWINPKKDSYVVMGMFIYNDFASSWAGIEPDAGEGQSLYVETSESANDPYLEITYVVEEVTVQAATSVSFTTATGNGNIVELDSVTADYYGVIYDTSSHASVPASAYKNGPLWSGYGGYWWTGPGTYGTGTFTQSMTSLDQDQLYYYRTFVHSTYGWWDYSDTEQSFHTLQLCGITTSAATSVMNTTARLPGNVTDAGYPASVTVTVFWGDNDGGSTPGSWDYSSAPTSPGQPQGVASFYKDITGLTPGGTYYFNARGNNGSGDVWAGSRSFAAQNTPPTVTTNAASPVLSLSATLNGNIDSVGGDPTCTNYGFVWDTSSHVADPGNTDPSATAYASYWKAGSGSGVGAISHGITTVARTTYYARACAYNNAGWDYGGEITFTTCDRPDVSTQAVTDATLVGGTYHGTIVAVWGVNCDTRGFVRSTSTHGDPGNVAPGSSGYEAQWTESGSYGAGAFSHISISCDPGTKYYIRACAHNTYGWSYGTEVHFGTLPEDPVNLTLGAIAFTSVDLSWTEGDHAAKTMIRYQTDSTTGTFPTSPADGTEAYFNADESCTVTSLTPGETYYFAAWSWIEGSDVWSSGYSTVVVTLSVPAPVSLKAVPNDATTVNLWWIVPAGMRSVPTVSTLLYGHVGDYPDDPPDPPGAGDFLVYTEITGDSGVHDYTWDNATAGTPYFFSVWFYDSATDNFTTAVSAICTTPAGYSGDTMPGDDSFIPPEDTHMSGVPIHGTVEGIADTWGMDHGVFWGFGAIMVAILLTMGAAISTKSGLMATGVGGLVLTVANTQVIVSAWVTVAFVFLGIVLTWVASRSYAS